jgi:hypothetical protein
MTKFFEKYKLWVSLSLCALCVAALAWFLVLPVIRKINGTTDAIQEKLIDSQLTRSRISQIPDMETAQKLFQDKTADFNVILDENNEVDFIQKMEAIADQTGNKIELKIADNQNSSQAPVQPAPDDQATADQPAAPAAKKVDPADIMANLPYGKYIVVQINLEGNYQQLLEFIHKLENLDYYVNIISVDAVKTTQDQDNQNLPPTNANPFGSGPSAPKPAPAKEIIKSTISIVAYLKK